MEQVGSPGVWNSYRAGASLATAGLGALPAGGGASASFGDVLGDAVRQASGQETAAAAASVDGLTGRAGTVDVVLALNRAEMAVQTAVAVRDRVIAAYQEVMRMPI